MAGVKVRPQIEAIDAELIQSYRRFDALDQHDLFVQSVVHLSYFLHEIPHVSELVEIP